MDIVKVKVGDEVVVSNGRGTKPYRATVEKVARVWITVRPTGSSHALTERFRLNDQTDGWTGAGGPGRFYTLEQWAEREAEMAAQAFLREQGITLEWGSPWRKRLPELADAVRKTLDVPA